MYFTWLFLFARILLCQYLCKCKDNHKQGIFLLFLAAFLMPYIYTIDALAITLGWNSNNYLSLFYYIMFSPIDICYIHVYSCVRLIEAPE